MRSPTPREMGEGNGGGAALEDNRKFGVDYNITFAAVIDMSSVKLILALANRWQVPAKHGDVPNAYVKAEKEGERVDIHFFWVKLCAGQLVRNSLFGSTSAQVAQSLTLEEVIILSSDKTITYYFSFT
ncbi:hypothetical protein P3T76_001713 [Phytophthora citrophthora]|uniref:Reverse transcriptase Ty1/copia-type domain-containing protein n=1 Tax=Phytophthora citrophthora TaxID=4793 RepID=A0AAD9H0W0_9STRA|nr:hypothetical protein P3T76_001713 [Phytophthora citrophthora]